MPTARITPDLEMYYEVDDYTDPWTQPETVLLLHETPRAPQCVRLVPTLAGITLCEDMRALRVRRRCRAITSGRSTA